MEVNEVDPVCSLCTYNNLLYNDAGLTLYAMGAVTATLTILLTFFILLGDLTLTFLSFLFKLLLFPFKNAPTYLNVKSERKKRKTKQSTLLPITKLKYFFIGVFFSFLFISVPLGIIALMHNLPNPETLAIQEVPQTTKIYDRHHTLLYQFYANQNRTVVKLSNIPTYLQEATVAIEDKNFYKNPGFDIVAILRAAIKDAKGHSLQGGSTITQQLIKTALLTPDQTIKRKAEEIILSFWAERLYSKDKILEMYLNQVAYGGTAWGVQAAAQTYFGKDVKELDLAEAAFLAGMPQAPTTYSPFGEHPTIWKYRQIEVLQKMQQLGYISPAQEKKAESEKLAFHTFDAPLLAPHFVMYVKDLLVKKYGIALVEKGGLSVVTSLDLQTQIMAQKVVGDEVAKDAYLNLTNGAALITNPQNGDIVAMIGSHDYTDPNGGAVNLATSLRQPGSSIKVVTYASALSRGYTAASMLDDSPISYASQWGSVYAPVNYDGRWHGQVTLRTALANSLNIPAVKLLNAIGIANFVALGKQMGISSLEDSSHYGLSLTLGSAEVTMLDMATAFGTIANTGKRVDLNPLLLVTDNKGVILQQKGFPTGVQTLDPGVSFILSHILADNAARAMEFGTNSPLLIAGKTVSVKTGTTDNKRDNWTDGFNEPGNSPQYVTIVWVGNNDNTPMSQALASGITGAAPIWHTIMAHLLERGRDVPLQVPSGVIAKDCFGHVEYFIKGTEQSVYCGVPTVPTISIPQSSPVVHIDSQAQGSQIHIQL